MLGIRFRNTTPFHLPSCHPLPLLAEPCSYLLLGVFASEDPGTIGVHSEVPARRATAVQVSPGDDGPVDVAEGVLLWESGRGHKGRLLLEIRWVSGQIVLWRIVLFRQGRLGMYT